MHWEHIEFAQQASFTV